MSSTVAGHQYDIFISYRHKDNKYDGWVTEFVANLRNELEATFKRELSVYFDQNQHDGIHETNDVADSLKDKVRCLVFVPILSRTYCDSLAAKGQKDALNFIRDEITYTLLGMNDEAISYLTKNPKHYLYLRDHPLFSKLRNDARFQPLLAAARVEYEQTLNRFSFLDANE